MSSATEAPSTRSRFRYILQAMRLLRYAKTGAVVVPGVFFVATLLTVVFDQTTIIEEFAVPGDDPGRKAYIADKLYARISDIQAGAKAAVAEQRLGVQSIDASDPVKKIANLKIIGTELPMTTVVDQLRGIIGIKETRVSGALIEANEASTKSFLLSARIRGAQTGLVEATGSTLDQAIEDLGGRLVEKLDPLTAGFYYLHGATNLDTVIDIAEHYKPKDPKEEVWALLLGGMALRDQTGQQQGTREYLCRAINLDPTFTPAWRILGNSLRADGSLGEAEYLARRLVYLRPDEPEGLRQLGNLRTECGAGAEKELEARQYFERAIALGRKRPAANADYLSLVEYARWLYGHYESDKPYLPIEPQQGFSPKRDYLEAAAAYLEEAASLAHDQESIYTTWARVLGYPRPDLSESAKTARYAKAERTLKQVLALPSHRPFVDFVMGELLTDEAVEGHKYKISKKEKFEKAQSYLERPVKAATWGEAQYDAMYARALAGQGKYEEAIKILSKYQNPKNANLFLVKWVRGEVFYNRSLQTQDRSMLEAAVKQLQDAHNLRVCGPRSEIIRDLLGLVQTEFDRSAPKEPVLEVSQGGAEPLLEKRTVYDPAARPNSDALKPDLQPREPVADSARPENGATQVGPEAAKLQLTAVQPNNGAAKLAPSAPTPATSPAKPDWTTASASVSGVKLVPACEGWPVLPEDGASAGSFVGTKAEALLSVHSAH